MFENSAVRYEAARLLGRRHTPRAGFRAAARRLYWIFIRRYECEICQACGRPVGRCTGSWWEADDAMWAHVVGNPQGVLCPPCFTAKADEAGVPVHWKVVAGV